MGIFGGWVGLLRHTPEETCYHPGTCAAARWGGCHPLFPSSSSLSPLFPVSVYDLLLPQACHHHTAHLLPLFLRFLRHTLEQAGSETVGGDRRPGDKTARPLLSPLPCASGGQALLLPTFRGLAPIPFEAHMTTGQRRHCCREGPIIFACAWRA